MIISVQPQTMAEGEQLPAPRLWMKQAGAEPGHVDGSWWPRSTDLAAELPKAFEHWVGPVTRVS
ncbi:DUF5994 family protein [Amycolatopsis sp. NPDC023774]|uniref:DUF5994 family protein n=1 Tax=Amycolatopsis sp. NPDC023774 TaxID=3155015 RepID=UPI0033E7C3F9